MFYFGSLGQRAWDPKMPHFWKQSLQRAVTESNSLVIYNCIVYTPPFQISLVWSWQPIELKSGDIPAPTLTVPQCAHPLWDKSALYTMFYLQNHTVWLCVPSMCPSHPLWDNRRGRAGRPSKRYCTLKFHSLPLLNVHKPLNLLNLLCFCPHRENEVQYVIANIDKDMSTHRKTFYILYDNVW